MVSRLALIVTDLTPVVAPQDSVVMRMLVKAAAGGAVQAVENILASP